MQRTFQKGNKEMPSKKKEKGFKISASNAIKVGVEQGTPRQFIPHYAATETVHAKYESDDDAGTYRARLYGKEDILPITRHYNTFYHQVHRVLTVPFEHGYGVLKRTGLEKYTERYREHKVRYYDAVEEAKLDFPNILDRAQSRLKKLGDEVNWPSADEWASQFYFKIDVREIDGTTDLRTALTKEEVEAIEKDIRGQLRDGNLEVYRRILTALRKSAAAQAQYKKKKNSKLYESTAREKIQDLLDAFDCLNVNGVDGGTDKELEAIGKDIAGMIGKSTFEEIKEDENVRNQSVTDTSRIAEKVEKRIRDIEDEIEDLV